MNAVRFLWFVFGLVCQTAANPYPEVCVLDDVECVTRGCSVQYQAVIDGVNGSRASLDPMYIEEIHNTRGSTNYSLTNIELTGLRNCVVMHLKLNVTESGYQHYMHCPQLVSNFNYKVTDQWGMEQNENVIATAYSYDILNTGEYGVYVDKRDFMPHFFIRAVHEGRYELKGQLIYDIVRELDEGDGHHGHHKAGNDNTGHASNTVVVVEVAAAESHVKSHDSQKDTIEYLFSVILQKAIRIVMEGVDAHNRSHLMGEIFPRAKKDCH